ncbi:hypothetical protein J6590_045974 [Homalodisca vitripennis]|nr:hypothetical protein J6590_045974 [Homalodisca vitripennis]
MRLSKLSSFDHNSQTRMRCARFIYLTNLFGFIKKIVFNAVRRHYYKPNVQFDKTFSPRSLPLLILQRPGSVQSRGTELLEFRSLSGFKDVASEGSKGSGPSPIFIKV